MPRHFFEWTRRLSAHLPSSCALCATDCRENLCADCRDRYFDRTRVRCPQCGIPIGTVASDSGRCGDCMQHSRQFDATVVATDYAAPVDHLVLGLKFGGQLALAPLLGALLHEAIVHQPGLPALPLLTVVPLSMQRLVERGFNQSLEIARPLARALNASLVPALLHRTRETQMQATLPPDERYRNVHGAFVVAGGSTEHLRGQHIGVVDDVMTTGETLDEIAATLKRCGATRVTNLVFARTPK